MKKIFSIVLSLAIVISVIPASTLSVSANEDYATRGEVVQILLNAADDYNPQVKKTDIIKGYDDGQLHEERFVTRAEALVMMKRAFGELPTLKGQRLREAIPKEGFTDIPVWANDELNSMFELGIVAGTEKGVFSPNQYVTKEQLDRFINRVYGAFGTNEKDDFYTAVNRAYLDEHEIPAGQIAGGTVYDVVSLVDDQVAELLDEVINSNPQRGTPEYKLKVMYNSIVDMESRNRAGYEPIKKDIEAIDRITSVRELSDLMVMQDSRSALELLMSFTTDIDAKDSSSYITKMELAVPGLPKELYKGENERGRQAYFDYMSALLSLCGQNEEETQKCLESYFGYEKELSNVSLTPDQLNNVDKVYNIYSLDELQQMFINVDIKSIFERSGYENGSRIFVPENEVMKKVAVYISEDNIDDIKRILKSRLIFVNAQYFGEDFRKAKTVFNKEYYGIEGSLAIEDEAIKIISRDMPDYVGKIYSDKYCTEEIENDIKGIIEEIKNIYHNRIDKLEWMSDATKQRAHLKLDAIIENIGAPDYSKMDIALDTADFKSIEDGGSYFLNAMEIYKANREYWAKKSKEKVDYTQWFMPPQTVNAFYDQCSNSITFPIAFFQGEIYNIDFSYEEKLGKIGTVIAHEITHAFDINGSKFDEMGNAADWWTEEDKESFNMLCDEVIQFYDGVESAPGILNNGELTVAENTADLGALACVTEIGMSKKNFDFKKLYESYAQLWATIMPRESIQNRAYTDVHSCGKIRVNSHLQNIDKFYEVFDIDENDGMYVPKEERVSIW